jgi:hypothetical protein
MATLANIRSEYKYALQDVGNIVEIEGSTTVRDKAIAQALVDYSRKFPYIKTVLVASVAGGYYALPSDWLDGFSRIVSVESPIDQSPPAYLSPKSWRLVRRESAPVIYIDPNPSASFRLTFVTKHDESAPTTIPESHEGALGKWAAMIAAQSMMAFYANTVQNNVDAVNYRSKEQEWRHVYDTLKLQLAGELREAEIATQRAADYRTYFSGWEV